MDTWVKRVRERGERKRERVDQSWTDNPEDIRVKLDTTIVKVID